MRSGSFSCRIHPAGSVDFGVGQNYLGRMVEGEGISALAQPYGWTVALHAVVVAVVLGIALLLFT